MLKMTLRNFWRLVALPAFVILLSLVLDKVMKDIINAPTPVGITPELTLIDTVDAHRARLVQGGESKFAAQCLAAFPRAFKSAEELTGIEQSVMLGVAGYESAGCAQPKDGPGNVMHITKPDGRHVKEAARLLGVKPGALDWRTYSEHSVVLGAVMLRDYTERTGSLATGLSAYRHGPAKASFAPTGDAYTRTVMGHIVLARRIFLSQETDIPFANESSIDPMEFPKAWWTVASPAGKTLVATR